MSAGADVRTPRDGRVDAALRAIPVSRMIDYGVPVALAQRAHRTLVSDVTSEWDTVLEALADELTGSGAASDSRTAAALLQCAQLAQSMDSHRKIELYRRSHEAMARYAATTDDLVEVRLPSPAGTLFGWSVSPRTPPTGAVVILGGLSGWGAVYLDQARALARQGLLAVLAEGPGQGMTRMASGIHLDHETFELFGRFRDHAREQGVDRVGYWGNSFGGLLAAKRAVLDAECVAVCINGAPLVAQVPEFRTVREQMLALFGATDETHLAESLGMLSLDRDRGTVAAAMLVVEGGRDPLLPLGAQDGFFELAQHGSGQLMRWVDGEHTIYNHAAERNRAVSAWFADQFSSPAHHSS